jgi:hypothetical protein
VTVEDIPGFTTDEERDELARISAQLDWHYRADAAVARFRKRLRKDERKLHTRVLTVVSRFAAAAALVLVTFALTGVPDNRPEIVPGVLSLLQNREAMVPEPEIAKMLFRDRASPTLLIQFAPLKQSRAGRLPLGPRFDLQLEVHNDRTRPITLDVGGETTLLRFDLRGPETRTLSGNADSPPFLVRHEVRVNPGERFLLSIPHLIGGTHGRLQGVYAAAPGRYTLKVFYRVGLKDEPRDLVVSSPPLTIDVKAP